MAVIIFAFGLPGLIDYAVASRIGGFDIGSVSGDPETRRLIGLLGLAGILAMLSAWLVDSLAWPGDRWTWLALGLVLICSGCALRYWAILTLGRFFRFVITVQNDHRVIRSGPYRLVRHPAYTGVILIQLGVGIALANSLSLLIFLTIPMFGFIPRIQREELALTADLGAEYQAYAATTKRLIPRIW